MIKKDLLNLRKNYINRWIPIISKPTENFLTNILNEEKPLNCLEIWSAVGYSSLFIANLISLRWGKLISFEITPHSYKEALENMYNFYINNITFYNLDFSKAPLNNLLSKKIDFVFVDAQKKDYLKYFKRIYKHLASWSTIIFDDVYMYHNKIQSLYSYIQKNQLNYKFFKLEDNDGILLINF